jgi:hypothetical protein
LHGFGVSGCVAATPPLPGSVQTAMRPASQHFLPRLLRSCGIVAVLVLIVLGSVQSAQASCGDWLVGHDMPAHAPQLASAAEAGGNQAKPAEAPRRRPCNGPSCGRAPVAPLAPSEAPTISPDLDRAALLSGLVPVEASTAGAWLAFDEPLLIPAVSGPPERPPRLA